MHCKRGSGFRCKGCSFSHERSSLVYISMGSGLSRLIPLKGFVSGNPHYIYFGNVQPSLKEVKGPLGNANLLVIHANNTQLGPPFVSCGSED